MMTFNTILRREGINPTSVRLLRHSDIRGSGPRPYNLWLAKDDRFELCTSLQDKANRFSVGDLLAVFVATPAKKTLFIALYWVDAVDLAPPGTICPVRQTDCGAGGHVLFKIRPDTRLSRYEGLLVIEWGPGYRSWVQWAERKDKPVLEIRR
jgi:hypothetical protein